MRDAFDPFSSPICAGHNAAPVRDYGTKDRCEMTSSNPGEGSLRLVGGATNNTGVLQVYLRGRWVGICGNGVSVPSGQTNIDVLGSRISGGHPKS